MSTSAASTCSIRRTSHGSSPAHSSRTNSSLATKRVSAFGADLTAEHGLGFALRTGQEVEWDDGEQFINQISRNDEHRAALQAMNLGGGIIVPMLARGRVLGACVFANHRQRVMSDEDRRLARTLGERAAVLLGERPADAATQRGQPWPAGRTAAAVAPDAFRDSSSVPGTNRQAKAWRSAATSTTSFRSATGNWLLVVGDVTGHGVEAAAATGLVRHTIRSAAMMGLAPSQILDHANNAMLNGAGALPSGVYCTIALAAFAAPTDETVLRWTTAPRR